VSEGGLFVTLLEKAMPGQLGFDVRMPATGHRKDAFWFGESQSRIVVTVRDGNGLQALEQSLSGKDVPCRMIGRVTGGQVLVDGADWGQAAAWKERYDTAIERHMQAYQSE
jgi:phosphoribosylformylglycinamidine synthase